ncbi:MAG: LysR family transcriptional regulator [Thermodesulfovibrionales bacterium]|nr:LysR family transcriptional regulator [Nitrospinota bacterium]MCG2709164.1 LysR family transcriptional regulator [Thermodesulfovibrionales bacterium]
MDIHQLRVFASVFKNKSFSKASGELYLTQPTVSEHIRTLENEFDCKLFDRLGRTIIPTKEAEVLYSHAMEIIEKANTLKETIGQFKKEVTGELIIGASTIPGTYLMPPVMAVFQKKYPSISFQILISDSKGIVEKVSRHELLMGAVGTKIYNTQIDYIPFMDDELIAVSSPSLIKKEELTLRELIKFPMVLREEGSGTRKETEKILEAKGISPENIKIAGIFGSTDAVKQAVKAGLGFSILSKFAVIDELKHKILKEIKLTDIQMKRKFYIVTHKKRTLPPAYATFLKHITAESKDI